MISSCSRGVTGSTSACALSRITYRKRAGDLAGTTVSQSAARSASAAHVFEPHGADNNNTMTLETLPGALGKRKLLNRDVFKPRAKATDDSKPASGPGSKPKRG